MDFRPGADDFSAHNEKGKGLRSNETFEDGEERGRVG
jgi:hypothetical protein